MDTLIGEAQRAGAIVVDGRGSDIRVTMKFIVPRIFEPAPGEFMVFGFAWSDFGAGANNLHAFANGKAIYHPSVSAAGETIRPQRSFTAASTTGN